MILRATRPVVGESKSASPPAARLQLCLLAAEVSFYFLLGDKDQGGKAAAKAE